MNLFESLYKTKISIKHNNNMSNEEKSDLIDYIDDIITSMTDYYDSVARSKIRPMSSDVDDIRAYQNNLTTIDTARRNSHNNILYGLLNIDKLSQKYEFEKCYGKFTQEEISNQDLIISNPSKRKEIAEEVFESVAYLVKGFEIEDKLYSTKTVAVGIANEMYNFEKS